MKAEKLTRFTNVKTGEFNERKSYVDLIFDDEKGYLFWHRKDSFKSFLDCPLPSNFTWSERGKIDSLKYFIAKDNQFLLYRSDSCIKPIGIKNICKITDSSERQAKVLVKKACSYSVMKQVEVSGVKYFAFNPIYCLKGNRITLTTFIIFQNELRRVLPDWVIERYLTQAKEIKPDIKIVE